MSEKKEYIDRNMLKRDFGGFDLTRLSGADQYETMMMYEICDEIDNMPIEDVVKVTRCENCIYNRKTVAGGMIDCEKNTRLVKPDHFCGFGKEKKHHA